MDLILGHDLAVDFDDEILEQGELISDKLNMLRLSSIPRTR